MSIVIEKLKAADCMVGVSDLELLCEHMKIFVDHQKRQKCKAHFCIRSHHDEIKYKVLSMSHCSNCAKFL